MVDNSYVPQKRIPEPPPSTTAGEAATPPKPDVTQLASLFGPPYIIRSVAISGLLLLALIYTMFFARELLIPIVAALVLSIVLAPVVRALSRMHIPEPIGAALILLGIIGTILAGIYFLSDPVTTWVQRMPQVAVEVKQKLRDLRAPVQQVQEASKQVEQITSMDANTPTVVVKEPSLIQRVATTLQFVVVQLGLMLLLLYFLLAVGDLFKQKLVRVIPKLSDKKRALVIVREIESQVSTYFLVILLINIGVGVVVGTALFFLGMPNPLLWGAMATILNFIPLIGPFVGVGVLTLVGLLTFDSATQALLPPAIYLAVHASEENFLVPSILGRRLTLNPVVIIVNVVFWGWLWGIPGALLAGPILVTVKVFCDHIEPLAAIGEFLSGPAPSLRDERAQDAK